MHLPASPIPREDLKQQANLLAAGVDTILERWAGLVYPEKIKEQANLPHHFDLYAHIPEVLSNLVELLGDEHNDGEQLMLQARLHAKARVGQGHDQRNIIKECLVLRQTVLGYLEEQNDGDIPHFWSAVNYITSLLDYVAMEITDHFFLHFTEVLQQRAESDPLTDLYNWQAFHDLVAHTMKEAKKYNGNMMLVILDLDAFKEVNDTRGHAVGDLILRHLANLLQKHTRKEDIVGRLGGDEFAICLRDADRTVVRELVTRLKIHLAPLKRELKLPDSFGFSYGYSIYPNDATSVDDLFLQADAQMYSKKRREVPNQDFNSFPIPENLPKPIVMVIDQTYSVRFLTEKTLQAEGFMVYSYSDCTDGLLACKTRRPDVLIIDQEMAEAERATLKELQANTEHPMAIIETYLDDNTPKNNSSLRKPFDPEKMVRIVHAQLIAQLKR